VEVLEYYKATVCKNTDILVDSDYDDLSPLEKIKAARDYTLAMAFLINADHARYGKLLADLHNQYSRGNNQFPQNLTSAYSMMNLYRPPIAVRPTSTTTPSTVSTNTASTTPLSNSSNISNTSSTSYSNSSSSVVTDS
jgi:hypothetical protein